MIDRTEAAAGVRKLHHIGFVVASIAEAAPQFAQSVYGGWDGEVILDPLQKVRVTFITAEAGLGLTVELVEPAAPESPVQHFLQRGGGLHHLCFEVDDLQKELEAARNRGGLVARPPAPAVAFAGRRIAWVYNRSKLLLELLQR